MKIYLTKIMSYTVLFFVNNNVLHHFLKNRQNDFMNEDEQATEVVILPYLYYVFHSHFILSLNEFQLKKPCIKDLWPPLTHFSM